MHKPCFGLRRAFKANETRVGVKVPAAKHDDSGPTRYKGRATLTPTSWTLPFTHTIFKVTFGIRLAPRNQNHEIDLNSKYGRSKEKGNN